MAKVSDDIINVARIFEGTAADGRSMSASALEVYAATLYAIAADAAKLEKMLERRLKAGADLPSATVHRLRTRPILVSGGGQS